jgi:cysteine--tRNA ligase
MGRKYLGEQFDIHGGGMDLVFPHHECEIAQAKASQAGEAMVRYWMHNNMITINGQKMGKSLGNFITLDEFFTGEHKQLDQAYSPMTIRFFILSAHYRGTVDFSNEALKAAEKGLQRLLDADALLDGLQPSSETSLPEVRGLKERAYAALNDDLNTPIVIAELFDAARIINSVHHKQATITAEDLEELRTSYRLFLHDLLGLRDERLSEGASSEAFKGAIDLLLSLRQEAKSRKDWATSDKIRDELTALGFVIKDTKEGTEWSLA